jgi:nucleoside-diphosphate-sugar epimerase
MKDRAADPLEEFLRVNLYGTENLAQQAARAGVKRFVYVSSVKVNGERTTEALSFTEKDPADPQDPYGVSKWQAEQALRRIASETALEVVIVRPPLVYGPGVKGNFLSLLACATHPSAAGQTYLISDGEDVSTAELVEKIAGALGRNSRSFHFPPVLLRVAATLLGRAEQMDRLFGSLCVDDKKIREELAWQPRYSLEDGLRATTDWYRNRHLR